MVKKSVQSNCSTAKVKKTYAQMTRNQRKVAIAQDVIKQLNVLRIKAGNGYVVPDDDFDLQNLLEFGVTPKQIAQKAKETCTFCARGAMMICKVDKFNSFNFDGIESFDCISQSHTTDALEDAFTDDELREIEGCFEQAKDSWSFQKNIWAEIEDDKDRLQAIMQNIIDHKGVFKPEVQYTVS
jgi:hypothetical protein